MDISSVILMVAVGGFTLVAAVWDMRTKRLPNWITVPAFVLGVIFHVVLGAVTQTPWYSGAGDGLLFTLAGFATGFLPLLVLWLIGGGGAGDVKLMGAVGAWLGPKLTFYTYIVSVLAAFLVSLCMLAKNKAPKEPTEAESRKRGKAGASSKGWRVVPYGVPVALATWLVLVWKIVLLPG